MTRPFTLVLFERDSLVVNRFQLWRIYLWRFQSWSEGSSRQQTDRTKTVCPRLFYPGDNTIVVKYCFNWYAIDTMYILVTTTHIVFWTSEVHVILFYHSNLNYLGYKIPMHLSKIYRINSVDFPQFLHKDFGFASVVRVLLQGTQLKLPSVFYISI